MSGMATPGTLSTAVRRGAKRTMPEGVMDAPGPVEASTGSILRPKRVSSRACAESALSATSPGRELADARWSSSFATAHTCVQP